MSQPLPLRVMVHESWDEVVLEVASDTTVGDLKRQALAATHAARDDDAYEVKFRGALMGDESQTLATAGVVPNAQLIVLSRRRQPVR
jgi:hypothetical protein